MICTKCNLPVKPRQLFTDIFFNQFKIFFHLIRPPVQMDNLANISKGMTDGLDDQIKETFLIERNKLFAFIRERVPDWEDAEDVLQDVFFQFVNRFETIESLEKVTSWLFAVARNRITDSYRKKRPQSFSRTRPRHEAEENGEDLWAGIQDDEANGPEALYNRALIMDELEEALEELPANQRDVFIWHALERKSFKEISAMTGIAVNTLISRKRYAVLHLRESLQELYEEG